MSIDLPTCRHMPFAVSNSMWIDEDNAHIGQRRKTKSRPNNERTDGRDGRGSDGILQLRHPMSRIVGLAESMTTRAEWHQCEQVRRRLHATANTHPIVTEDALT